MTWFFGHRRGRRDAHVTVLEQQARDGEHALLRKLDELDSRVRLLNSLNDLNDLSEEALKDLGGPHRV